MAIQSAVSVRLRPPVKSRPPNPISGHGPYGERASADSNDHDAAGGQSSMKRRKRQNNRNKQIGSLLVAMKLGDRCESENRARASQQAGKQPRRERNAIGQPRKWRQKNKGSRRVSGRNAAPQNQRAFGQILFYEVELLYSGGPERNQIRGTIWVDAFDPCSRLHVGRYEVIEVTRPGEANRAAHEEFSER